MDFRDSPADAEFRSDLRAWLANNISDVLARAPVRASLDGVRLKGLTELQQRMARDRWIAINWPPELGGRGASAVQVAIYAEELAKAGVPRLPSSIGINHIAPLLLRFGTAAQRDKYLRPMLTGAEIWCQAFSEPDAGSDLRSIRTRARISDGCFIVRGQKTWTSFAQFAKWCLVLTKTPNFESPKSENMSLLIVDMESSGIEVRPIQQISGDSHFNEVFFDNVFVPADQVVGEVGAGWRLANEALSHERAGIAIGNLVLLESSFQELLALTRRNHSGTQSSADGALVRQTAAELAIGIHIARLLIYRSITAAGKSRDSLHATIAKLSMGLLNQSLTEAAMSILGMAGSVVGDGHDDHWSWSYEYLRGRGDTIAGGTTEILRRQLARRSLGLPNDRYQ